MTYLFLFRLASFWIGVASVSCMSCGLGFQWATCHIGYLSCGLHVSWDTFFVGYSYILQTYKIHIPWATFSLGSVSYGRPTCPVDYMFGRLHVMWATYPLGYFLSGLRVWFSTFSVGHIFLGSVFSNHNYVNFFSFEREILQ